MGTINFPGLSTGLDTSTIISQLIAADSNIKTMYQNRVTKLQDKQESLVTFKSDLNALQTAVKSLSNADDLKLFNISTSDDTIVTADATSSAYEGNHSIVVNQLATADRWVQNTGSKYKEDYVGTGTFIYSYGGKETTITTNSTTTLEDLVGLINNDSNNPGVTASLLSYNNQYHLVLSGKNAGSDYAISVNSSSTETWETGSELTVDGDNADTTTLLTKLDSPQFTGSTFNGDETLVISGTDHNGNSITPFTLNLTSNTKISHILDAIEEAYDGNVKAVLDDGKIIVTDTFSGESEFTILLTYNANGSSATLAIPALTESAAGGATAASLTGFAASDFTRSQVAQDSKIKVDGYPISGAVSEIQQIAHSSAITSGTFTLSYGGYTTSAIAYNASTSDIQAALEALPSVEAGDITVSGDALDGTGTLAFTFSNTLGDVSGILMNASNLSDPTLTVTEQTKGVDEYISRSSNSITDVVDGITFYLHGVSDSEGEQITLTRNSESLTTKINAMVSAYNTVVSFIKDKTAYNTETKVAGVLMGDYTVTAVNNQLYTTLINKAKGFLSGVDDYLMPANIGLEIDSNGQLSLDSDTLNTAISDNYLGVLALIGATKTGSSNSSTIDFYSASDKYTTAGQYNVQVTVSGGVITSAKIKTSDEGESEWRDMTISDNTVTGNSTFDSINGYPLYAENGLQLSINTSSDGVFTATVNVKQGFAGAIEDALNTTTKDTTGSVDIDNNSIQDEINSLNDRISEETDRLAREKDRLTARFANLEATLTLLQSQMAALGLK